jgi:tetratricopeptide (TPR) repeat protein
MPSHIYVRLGDWGDVISGNIRSQASALRQPAPGGRVSKHFLHALDYLVYGFLQLADDERALQEVSKANADTEWQLDSGPGAYALSAAPARFAIERRAWKKAATLELRAVPYSWDRYPWAEALTHAARGLGAARSGDVEAARASIDELDRLEGLTRNSWWQRRIRLERDVISGWIAHEQGRASAAVQLIGNAAEEELSAGKLSVEPGHTLYAVEQLGELLLELDRPREALEAFQRSLADSPKRFHSLFGAGRAAELAKMDEEATGYYAALTEMVVAGNDRPQVQHALDLLAKAKQ